MKRTLDELKSAATYDVCIIGSGPSGMTLCAELATHGLSILVIESGADAKSPAADALRTIETSGIAIRENSRERILGGASETWGGMSAPLDPIDYERRPYASQHEGWPISATEIAPYLAQAGRRYRFAMPEDFLPKHFLSPEEQEEVPWETLEPKVFLAVRPPFQFGKELRYLFAHPHIDLMTAATVTELIPDEGRITSVRCRGVCGEDVSVTAKVFVLAAGAIENARLLLNSNSTSSRGVGNEHDQVGRYLMNHPKGYRGRILLTKAFPRHQEYFWKKERGYAGYIGLRLSEEQQRAHQVLNAYVRLEAGFPWTHRIEPKVVTAFMSHGKAFLRALLGRGGSASVEAAALIESLPQLLAVTPSYIGLLLRRLSYSANHPTHLLPRYFLEMEPRSDNRVTLSDTVDTFGMPIPRVHHEPSELDSRSFFALQDALGKGCEEQGIGALQKSEAVPDEDASHHLGSTRMGNDPQTSVVNPDLRVHSIENLYIGGGSVFPTSGCANPTLMMSALSIRLAEHLQKDVFRVQEKKLSPSGATPIIIIGAGERVRTDILPVLESLPETFSIHKIYGRSRRALFGKERVYDVEPLSMLQAADVAKAQIIYLSIPAREVSSVLEMLRAHECSHIDLILPTPVSTGLVIPEGRFRRIIVEEDMVLLPWLPALKRAIEKELGTLKEIVLDRSAYKYHAIALIKTLCNSSAGVLKSRFSFRHGRHFMCGDIRATLIEPRDYSTGRMTLVCERGTVTDTSIECLADKEHYCKGFRIGSITEVLSEEESRLFGMLGEKDTVITRMHDCKRVGLRRLLIATLEDPKTNPWSLIEGKSDVALAH